MAKRCFTVCMHDFRASRITYVCKSYGRAGFCMRKMLNQSDKTSAFSVDKCCLNVDGFLQNSLFLEVFVNLRQLSLIRMKSH
jgi:hypothetical protein